jgi:hypothetical protein
VRDVAASERFGGRGVLVLTGAGTAEAGTSAAQGWLAVPDLATAVHLILSSTV